MSGKRAGPEIDAMESSPTKKHAGQGIESIGQVATVDELDAKVLKFQNKRLAERIEVRRKAEVDLRGRIEQLEKRLSTDDDVLMIVNRYWNQLDEDVRLLLQRFDAETADERETENESKATTSFLSQLSTWDNKDIEEKLKQRVSFSKRAIGKLIQSLDRLLQRHDRLMGLLKEKEKEGDTEGGAEEKDSTDVDKEEKKDSSETAASADLADPKVKESEGEGQRTIDSALREEVIELRAENLRLHDLSTELQEKNHRTSLKFSELDDHIERYETEVAEMKNKMDNQEYDLEQANQKGYKVELRLSEANQRLLKESSLAAAGGAGSGPDGSSAGHSAARLSKHGLATIHSELEEQVDLAKTRLAELEQLQDNHQVSLRKIEQLQMDLKTLPESVIVETTEYKCLKSQYSVLYNETLQIITKLEEARNTIQISKSQHLQHVEQMESEELACQKQLRDELLESAENFSQLRMDYDTVCMQLEKTHAAYEQTGPINKEMRHLIASLQNHNGQLKGELSRYKKKYEEAQAENFKLRELDPSERHEVKTKIEAESAAGAAGGSATGAPKTPAAGVKVKQEAVVKKEEKDSEECKEKQDSEAVKDLKAQLKKEQDGKKEMKLLLDMYKGVGKEQRDKAQLMTAEKRAQQQIEELKAQLKKAQDTERRDRRKMSDEEAVRKIKKLEDTVSEQAATLANQKQDEAHLLNDMEITGEAFEDMKEQNIRLVEQLKEKDEANFKLMSERIKGQQIQKLLKEEKERTAEQIPILYSQVEQQNQVVRRLEEKERALQNSLSTTEKELSLRQQVMELHKKKAIESAQTAADLNLHLEKYHGQLKEAQTALLDKMSTFEQQSFKCKRVQEELAIVRKKLERSQAIELAGKADEVLMEEIREYKSQLTCPSCKVKRKDAVLTKCFHVFCLECLKTRYETRQRKCPKCNAAFGANDYHRIYLD